MHTHKQPANKQPSTITALEELFNKAAASGFKKPSLRAEGLLFKRAPDRGVNAGGVYVTANGGADYLGKILRGNVMVDRSVYAVVQAVAAQPTEYAIKYGQETGVCSICGRPLVCAISVANAIGPICADKLGIPRVAPASADLSLL